MKKDSVDCLFIVTKCIDKSLCSKFMTTKAISTLKKIIDSELDDLLFLSGPEAVLDMKFHILNKIDMLIETELELENYENCDNLMKLSNSLWLD